MHTGLQLIIFVSCMLVHVYTGVHINISGFSGDAMSPGITGSPLV